MGDFGGTGDVSGKNGDWTTEKELILRVTQGDEAAFRQLFDFYAPRVFKFVVFRTGDRQLAEEVMQDTLMAVWKAGTKLLSVEGLGAWITRIARNKMVDALRIAGRGPEHQALDEQLLAGESVDDELSDRVVLKQTLGRLEQEKRELVYLVFYMGLSYHEISVILDIPEGTVKSRVFHVRKELKRLLERRETSESM